jgi:hypothetical protein
MSTRHRNKPSPLAPRQTIADTAQRVAATTGMALDNPAVKDIARLEVAMAREEKALDDGHHYNTANLLNLRAALHDAYQKAGALQPRKVEIAFVQGVQGYYECVHCHQANYLAPDRYEPITGKYDPTETKPHGQIEANNGPSGDGTPSPAMPLQATQTNAQRLNPAPAPTPADSVPERSPDRWRGEYIGPTGHVEVLPLKRLRRPDWHRNPDPADAQPVAVEHGLLR